MKITMLACSLLGISFPVHAAVGISHIGALGGNQFGVFQTFEKNDYTGFAFTFNGGSAYTFNGSFLDEGLDLYRVFLTNEFTPNAITNGNFTKFELSSSYHLPSVFYVGLETPSRAAVALGATLPPAYGWARVGNSGGVLTILDHAIDYSGNGLIVGTTTVVPEPSVCGLMATGLVSLMLRRRR